MRVRRIGLVGTIASWLKCNSTRLSGNVGNPQSGRRKTHLPSSHRSHLLSPQESDIRLDIATNKPLHRPYIGVPARCHSRGTHDAPPICAYTVPWTHAFGDAWKSSDEATSEKQREYYADNYMELMRTESSNA